MKRLLASDLLFNV